MRRAVSVPNAGSPADLVDLAVDVEAAGYDGFFLWDHLQLDRAMALDLHDPWVLLGAIAQVTDRVRIGTMVTPISRRRPWKLAKEVTTLDHLSGGRVILGIGLGFPPEDDFAAFGDDPTLAGRAAVTDEALDLLDRLLRGGPVSHTGTTYVVDAELRPAAHQVPRPPVWIAAMAPRTAGVRRAARWDGVFPVGGDGLPLPPDDLRRFVGGLADRGDVAIVSGRHPDHTAAAYEEVGTDWLVDSTWPEPGWLEELRQRLGLG